MIIIAFEKCWLMFQFKKNLYDILSFKKSLSNIFKFKKGF